MTVKNRLSMNKIRNHLTYDFWKYLLLAVGIWVGVDLLFTQTAYRSPQDKRVDVYVMSATVTDDLMDSFFQPLKQQAVPDMELVEGVTMLPASDEDVYTGMVLMTRLAAADGDIYLLPAKTFKSIATQGWFMPLDELVENGTINADGLTLDSCRLTIVNEETGTAETHLYGIPTDDLYGFMDGLQFDNRGCVMAITVNNGNDGPVIRFFDALLQAGRGPKPEWLLNIEQEGAGN